MKRKKSAARKTTKQSTKYETMQAETVALQADLDNTAKRIKRKTKKKAVAPKEVARKPLTHQDVDRLGEWLASELEYDGQRVARLILLLDHLESLAGDPVMFNLAIWSLKQQLFIGTTASSDARHQFEDRVHQQRGKLLKWPRAV